MYFVAFQESNMLALIEPLDFLNILVFFNTLPLAKYFQWKPTYITPGSCEVIWTITMTLYPMICFDYLVRFDLFPGQLVMFSYLLN